MKRICKQVLLYSIVMLPMIGWCNFNNTGHAFSVLQHQIGSDTNFISGKSSGYPTIYTNLLISNDNTNVLADGVATSFSNKFSAAVDANDAAKFWNAYDNIAEERNGSMLSIEFRPIPKVSDTVFYKLYLRQMKYSLQIFSKNIPQHIPCNAFIIDKYLNTKTLISLTDTTLYSFEAGADTNSYRNRFLLVLNRSFNTSPVLVTKEINEKNPCITGIAAIAKNNGISIYPNPVTNASSSLLRFNGIQKGVYVVELYNPAGNKIISLQIHHDGTNTSYKLPVSNNLLNGVYYLFVRNAITKEITRLKININM